MSARNVIEIATDTAAIVALVTATPIKANAVIVESMSKYANATLEILIPRVLSAGGQIIRKI